MRNFRRALPVLMVLPLVGAMAVTSAMASTSPRAARSLPSPPGPTPVQSAGLTGGRVAARQVQPASSGGCYQLTGAPPASPGSLGTRLLTAAVLSPCDTWAVGYDYTATTDTQLAEYWNGSSWSQTTLPSGTTPGLLAGVSGSSASNVIAVGVTDLNESYVAAADRWNGSHWVAAGPVRPGAGSGLSDVVATAHYAWAVGDYYKTPSSDEQSLVEYWNGGKWTADTSLGSYAIAALIGVTVLSPKNVWAVGGYTTSPSSPVKTLILHYNGNKWEPVASPNAGIGANVLYSVSGVSASNVWAVGYAVTGSSGYRSIIEHWNGSRWSMVASPDPSLSALYAVTATTAGSAWAVGLAGDGTFVVHWNGKAWTRVTSPGDGSLYGIGASSDTNLWMTGEWGSGQALAIHCC
jgi:hypothetical protein